MKNKPNTNYAILEYMTSIKKSRLNFVVACEKARNVKKDFGARNSPKELETKTYLVKSLN